MLLADNAELVAVMDANGQLGTEGERKIRRQIRLYTEEKTCSPSRKIDAVSSPLRCSATSLRRLRRRGRKSILLEKPLALSSGGLH